MLIRPAELKDCSSCYELSKIKEFETTGGEDIPEWWFQTFVKENQLFYVAESSGG